MLTKTQELELLDKTIDGLPDSYLRDILTSERDAIVAAVSQDFGFIDLAGIMRQVVEERAALAETQTQLGKAREDLREVTRQQSRLSDSLNEIRSTAKRIFVC